MLPTLCVAAPTQTHSVTVTYFAFFDYNNDGEYQYNREDVAAYADIECFIDEHKVLYDQADEHGEYTVRADVPHGSDFGCQMYAVNSFNMMLASSHLLTYVTGPYDDYKDLPLQFYQWWLPNVGNF